MSKRLLYLRGEPGSGKRTVATVLEQRLGWKVFWLHDLDAVCRIVGRYPLPRLMDKVSWAVLEELMADDQDIIYVRPSRDTETVESVRWLAHGHGYATYLVRLWASYETLVERVTHRGDVRDNIYQSAKGWNVGGAEHLKDEFRVSNREELDTYLKARPWPQMLPQECILSTEGKTPEQTVDELLFLTGLDKGIRPRPDLAGLTCD